MNGWTDARRAEAEKRYRDGQSASHIAEAMRAPDFKPSRNAIIGLLHRKQVTRAGADEVKQSLGRASLRLPKLSAAPASPPPSPKKPAVAKAPPVNAAPKPQAPPRSEPTVVAIPRRRPLSALLQAGPQSVGLVDLHAHACKFPVGAATGEHQLFCGLDRADGEDLYCAEHARLAGPGKAKAA